MKKTEIIIFSKNRTLQLKSLLLSMKEYFDLDEEKVSILYVADPGIDYGPLMKQFKCNFVKETDFLKDVKNIVNNSSSEYISFMVDDSIFRDYFSWEKVEDLLDSRSDIDTFTFRVGNHIECGKLPEFEEIGDDMLAWDTSEDLGRYWNYFWELCSSVYRKDLVLKYLSKCRAKKETFPNPFEFHYYSCMPSTNISGLVKLVNNIRFAFKKKSNKLACFRNSKSMTQGVNLVAELKVDRQEFYSTEELHKKMLEGYVADYKRLQFADLKVPQPGPKYFKLVKESEMING